MIFFLPILRFNTQTQPQPNSGTIQQYWFCVYVGCYYSFFLRSSVRFYVITLVQLLYTACFCFCCEQKGIFTYDFDEKTNWREENEENEKKQYTFKNATKVDIVFAL